MPNRIWKFRFPDGHVEHRNFEQLLARGDEVNVRGARWIVAQVTDHSVTLAPTPDGDSAPVTGSSPPPGELLGYVDV